MNHSGHVVVSNQKIVNFVGARRKLKLKRMIHKGLAVFIASASVIGGTYGVKMFTNGKVENNNINIDTSFDDNNIINTSIEDLSSLNVVLVNDGIDDDQFNKAVEDLAAAGLDFEIKNITELNKVDNGCFISLINYDGDDYKVVANSNSGNNNADLLAIGMSVAFDKNTQKGVYDVSSSTPELIPSNIEKAVGDRLVPEVTIVVPKGEIIDIDKLLEGLARYKDYFQYGSVYDDSFLLRPTADDYADSTDPTVLRLNDLDSSYLIPQDRILQAREYPESFQSTTEVVVNKQNVRERSK